MGKGYNHHLHHHPHKPTFLPILCSRPSIKDASVSLQSCRDRRHSSSFFDDPLSPKISCIGQVKRNNTIVGFSATSHHKFSFSTTPGTNSHHSFNVKYFKLRKLFSGKNLSTTTAATAATNGVKSCGRREGTNNCNKVRSVSDSNSISIEDLDPPLPVIKRVGKRQGEREDRDTLWQRRSGRAALESLQIKEIQPKRNHLAPNNTATV